MESIFEDIEVELIDVMGSDLSVVNAARVSMDKYHQFFNESTDEKLIKYLADNGHWSPFAHPHLSVRIKAPIFVARQLVKHQVGLVWNEVSRRYVDSDPTFYPCELRERAKDVKQGSGDTLVNMSYNPIRKHSYDALQVYKYLLQANVAPEVARAVLPLNTMTEWIWTGSLYAFIRVVRQRVHEHAQREANLVGLKLLEILSDCFPHSTKALIGDKPSSKAEESDKDVKEIYEVLLRIINKF